MTFPTPLERSFLYSTLLLERPPLTELADMFCQDCGLQHVDCECNSLPAYTGSDPSNYRSE